MPNNDLTLKAKWQANNYIITFNGNGADNAGEEGIMPNLMATYDQSIILTQNTFTKNLHQFMGWALTFDGEVKYSNQASVSNLAESEEVTLWAVWAPQRKLTVNLNGGQLPEGVEGNEFYFNDDDFPLILPPITKNPIGNLHFEFLGWYDQNSTAGNKYVQLTIPADYTIYAIWDEVYHFGEYPQTKVTDQELITILNGLTPVVSTKTISTSGAESHTEQWQTITYDGNKYEKVGSHYYKYEPIAFKKLADGTYYSKRIIDYSPFDNGQANSNVYDTSYVKRYLNEVFKTKSGITVIVGLSREQLLNASHFSNDAARAAVATDYAAAIYSIKKTSISWVHEEEYPNSYWTRTPLSMADTHVFYVYYRGSILNQYSCNLLLGLRPIISP